jgi:MFS family permease
MGGMSEGAPHWRVNMYVCLAGSFTTLTAMAMIVPFMPIYVEQLGVHEHAAIVRWTGLGYSAAFLGAGIMSPIWGRVADVYGRKQLLLRASFAMAILTALLGMAQSVEQVVLLRLMQGFLGGYSSGAVVLVATQTPREHVGWALGVLSTGNMAGMLIGPLIGGVLPDLVGVRGTFWLLGGLIFCAFVGTLFLVREDRRQNRRQTPMSLRQIWASIADKRPVYAALGTAMLLLFANMTVEPILTLYVGQFVPERRAVLVAGVVMAATAVGSMITAPRLGKLTDRIGPPRVIVLCLAACGVLLVPQALVTAGWQMVALRFLMGMSLAGLMPAINAWLRLSVPQGAIGGLLGLCISAQYVGQVAGPMAGSYVSGLYGMRAVFLATAVIVLGSAAANWRLSRTLGRAAQNSQ